MNTPAKYRKKPVVIEAMQLTQTNAAEVKRWVESFYQGRVLMRGGPGGGSRGATLIIKTLEGDHEASVGDQVIRGVQDEAYPCKPDIFEATYEVTSRHAHTAVPALTAAVRDVLALHREDGYGECSHCPDPSDAHWRVPYPCPTVRALAAHLDLTD